MNVIIERFKNLEQFINIGEERPPNAVFSSKKELSSQRDETKTKGRFSGVNTYADAMNILREGYKEPLDKMKKAILKIGETDTYKRPRPFNDFVGFTPHVPNHLMNLPQTMINREKQENKAKTVHLIYSFCAAAQTGMDEMIKGGVNFISLVNSLEKQGYRVKIDIIFTAVENRTAASFTINVKEYGQQLNLLKLTFPLVHPAMLRRLAFKWLETTPELQEQRFINGYGMPLNYHVENRPDREREFVKKHGIIKDGFYCNVYEAMKAKNIEELAKTMGLK